ncbi:MAG TPA: hypothetical protein VHB97_24135 [Polyangia bacterium]|nr:hypothetical protein [Polyangia bacterium]
MGTAIAISLVCGGVAHARGTCAVETKKSPPLVVEVAPKEVTPFKLRIEGVPASIEPGGLETPATVRVHGALVFEAHLPNGEIPARLKRAVEDLSGMVHLAQATEKLTLHANVLAKRVDASVKLPGVELRGLTLPCDALTLDDVAPPKLSIEDAGEARFVAKGTTLHFRSAAGGKGAAVEVAVDDPSALELKRVEEQGGWMRVTTRWPDGTTLHGWVKRDELVEEGAHHERIGDMVPLGAGEGPRCDPPRLAASERIVTALVAAGTQVFGARYLGPWAKVVDGSKVQLRVRAKDDWAEIVSVPGIVCPIDDAWIPRAAAKIPVEAPVAQ